MTKQRDELAKYIKEKLDVETVDVIDLDKDVPEVKSEERADYIILIRVRENKNVIIVVEEAETAKQPDLEQVEETVRKLKSENSKLRRYISEHYSNYLPARKIVGIVHALERIDLVLKSRDNLRRLNLMKKTDTPYLIIKCQEGLIGLLKFLGNVLQYV